MKTIHQFLRRIYRDYHRIRKTPDIFRRKLHQMISNTKFDQRFLNGWSFSPAMVAISPTLRCNLNCVSCGLQNNLKIPDRIPAGTQIDREMSRENILAVADQLSSFRPVVFISGGEPTMYPHLIPFIQRLNEKKRMYICMITNGLKLGDMAEDLLDAGLTNLQISIDGTGEVYNRIRGQGMFKEFHQSLSRFMDVFRQRHASAPVLTANFTVTPLNQNGLTDTVRYVMDQGFSQIQVQHMISITPEFIEAHNSNIKDPYDRLLWTWGENLRYEDMDIPALKTAMAEARHIVSQYEGATLISIPDLDRFSYEQYYEEKPLDESLRLPCRIFYRACVIYPDGSVIPSCACYLHRMGNVLVEPLRKIWNGRNYRYLRTHFNKTGWMGACEKCQIPYTGCL